jgi:hypothetical protein
VCTNIQWFRAWWILGEASFVVGFQRKKLNLFKAHLWHFESQKKLEKWKKYVYLKFWRGGGAVLMDVGCKLFQFVNYMGFISCLLNNHSFIEFFIKNHLIVNATNGFVFFYSLNCVVFVMTSMMTFVICHISQWGLCLVGFVLFYKGEESNVNSMFMELWDIQSLPILLIKRCLSCLIIVQVDQIPKCPLD